MSITIRVPLYEEPDGNPEANKPAEVFLHCPTLEPLKKSELLSV